MMHVGLSMIGPTIQHWSHQSLPFLPHYRIAVTVPLNYCKISTIPIVITAVTVVYVRYTLFPITVSFSTRLNYNFSVAWFRVWNNDRT